MINCKFSKIYFDKLLDVLMAELSKNIDNVEQNINIEEKKSIEDIYISIEQFFKDFTFQLGKCEKKSLKLMEEDKE